MTHMSYARDSLFGAEVVTPRVENHHNVTIEVEAHIPYQIDLGYLFDLPQDDYTIVFFGTNTSLYPLDHVKGLLFELTSYKKEILEFKVLNSADEIYTLTVYVISHDIEEERKSAPPVESLI